VSATLPGISALRQSPKGLPGAVVPTTVLDWAMVRALIHMDTSAPVPCERIHRLFDRRCRTDTALTKLAQLRRRVSRFKEVGKILRKLQSANLDKALTFLDDKLFPSTSNAVERGNRRPRKMQKTVYRVRTQENISKRIALDMFRDSQKPGRTCTIKTLHKARAMKNTPL
jgi:hypothetical protein